MSSASDDKHFYRPTFMAWQPDGSFYVADGYANTRVVKFDKDGKYLTAWGEKGEAGGKEMRPNYFNNVHGVAIDPQTREVYINDRGNHRIQIFDENGVSAPVEDQLGAVKHSLRLYRHRPQGLGLR